MNVCIISVLQTVSLLIQDIVQSTTQWGRLYKNIMIQSAETMIYRVLYFTIQPNLINVSLKSDFLKCFECLKSKNQLIRLEETSTCNI